MRYLFLALVALFTLSPLPASAAPLGSITMGVDCSINPDTLEIILDGNPVCTDFIVQQLHDLWWGLGPNKMVVMFHGDEFVGGSKDFLVGDSEGWYGLQRKRTEYMVHGIVGNSCRLIRNAHPVPLALGIVNYEGAQVSFENNMVALHAPEKCRLEPTYYEQLVCLLPQVAAAKATHEQWQPHILGARQFSLAECRAIGKSTAQIDAFLKAVLPTFTPVCHVDSCSVF